MSRTKDFATDLSALSTNVDKDVGRFVKLLRGDRRIHSESSESMNKTDASLPASVEARETPVGDPASAAPSEHRSRPPARKRQKPQPDELLNLQKITTEIPRETDELLTEATLRQKLKKLKPDTRKDIHNEALQDWFRKHGYSA